MTDTQVRTATLPWAEQFTDPALDGSVTTGLAAVEDRLWSSIRNDQALLNETSSHLLSAGGKRFRPMLALLWAQFAEPGRDEVVQGATACELIHLATLYHDDVMDESKLRRGVESANARWDNSIAILTGDFLFAVAAKLISTLGEFVVDIHTQTSKRLVSGQLRETVGWSPGMSREAHYLKIISDKTASLFSASCQIGAHVAGLPDNVVALADRYAEELGLAYQLSDDVLDIVGSEAIGKPVGSDLREGVPTMPTILVQEQARPEDARLIELLDADLGHDESGLAEAIDLLAHHDAIEWCRTRVNEHVARANAVLAELDEHPARTALGCLARSMAARAS